MAFDLSRFILNRILQITVVLNFAVRQITKLETNIVSVERVKEYSETTPEADWESEEERQPPEEWPSQGRIELQGYSTRWERNFEILLIDHRIFITNAGIRANKFQILRI